MKRYIIIPALLATLAISACGETPADTSATDKFAAGTEKLEQQLEQEKAKTKQLEEQAEATPEATPESKIEQAEREVEESGDKVKIPTVVGMDHQLAQDTMQASGFYMLEEIDCTGQNRLLLLDRNWTVEEQKPAAGKQVSTDSTITLCSIKDTE